MESWANPFFGSGYFENQGVTNRLGDVSDIVALLEASERGLEGAT